MSDTPRNTFTLALEADMQREIDRLKAELAEAQKDAERYRWLRDSARKVKSDSTSIHYWSVRLIPDKDHNLGIDGAIDAAIDAAREEPK